MVGVASKKHRGALSRKRGGYAHDARGMWIALLRPEEFA